MSSSTDTSLELCVAVAPNEYITKYAFNRNFAKLIGNDKIISDKISTTELEKVLTYNKNKTYSKNEYVFFKVDPSDEVLYLLKSAKDGNTHKPTVAKSSTGKLYVVSTDYWKIAGIPNEDSYSVEKPTKSPKSYQVDSVDRAEILLHTDHESIAQHPSGVLNKDSSNKLLKNFSNLSSDRSIMHFPYRLKSLKADKTLQHGYMRQWDNGILEYDMTYRLGYQYDDDLGRSIICANCLDIKNRNQNSWYFKNPADLQLFNQQNSEFVTTEDSIHYNLNNKANAYHGVLNFPEPFKDLNYMVFTTNIKNVETESQTSKNSPITDYDQRLIIEGTSITGWKYGSNFKDPLNIPDDVTQINEMALADIYETQGYEVVINSSTDSKLALINQQAFVYSQIRRFMFPKALRYIGKYAFSACSKLSAIEFYIDNNNPGDQVKIDINAFNSAPIKYVDIYYPLTFASTNSDRDLLYYTDSLIDRLQNKVYRKLIGLNSDAIIRVNGIPQKLAYSIYGYLTTANAADLLTMKESSLFDNAFLTVASTQPKRMMIKQIEDFQLSGQYFQSLSINMDDNFITEEMLYGMSAETLTIVNLDKCKTISQQYFNVAATLSGFGFEALRSTDISTIIIDEENANELVEIINNTSFSGKYENIIGMKCGTSISTTNSYMVMRDVHADFPQLVQYPKYLDIVNDKVVSCNFEMLSDFNYNVEIPEGITAIGEKACWTDISSGDNRCLFVHSISIPSTIEFIGDQAFYDDGQLTNIVFSSHIDKLRYIGLSSIQNTALSSFYI